MGTIKLTNFNHTIYHPSNRKQIYRIECIFTNSVPLNSYKCSVKNDNPKAFLSHPDVIRAPGRRHSCATTLALQCQADVTAVPCYWHRGAKKMLW